MQLSHWGSALLAVVLGGYFLEVSEARPSGSPVCYQNQYTYPSYSRNREKEISEKIVFSCDENFQCGVYLEDNKNFQGILIHSSTGGLQNNDDETKGINGGCLTHQDSSEKSQISFKWNPLLSTANYTKLYVTIVTQRENGAHLYQIESKTLSALGTIHIVGAGPGGLGAARWLHKNFPDSTVNVYERGFDPETLDWYTKSISSTTDDKGWLTNPTMGVNTSGEYDLASMVGGQQNINGAVYAPGTPEDLAESVNITVKKARFLQNEAGKYVPHKNHMMWECLVEGDCDDGSFAFANAKMARRSVAFELPFSVFVNTTISKVSDSQIVFENGTITELGPYDKVILSAGALVSPQLINKMEFIGWNHYYTTDLSSETVEKQTFEYPESEDDNGTEINVGNLPSNSGSLKITMKMLPTIMEYHKVNKPYQNPEEFKDHSQAWHFAGTMNHTDFKIDNFEKIYSGDAGALKTPFNCHTSMPAVAVGIAAAHRAMGVPIGALDAPAEEISIKTHRLSPEEELITYSWTAVTALYFFVDLKWLVPTKKIEGVVQRKVGLLVF